MSRELPLLRQRYQPDIVVVNGENAAHGFGITEEIFLGFIAAGADVVTLGNHSFDQREALIFIERYPNLLRPVNWPAGCPGRGTALVDTPSGRRVLVMNAMGRVMIEPVLDDPFPAVQRELDSCPMGQRQSAASRLRPMTPVVWRGPLRPSALAGVCHRPKCRFGNLAA